MRYPDDCIRRIFFSQKTGCTMCGEVVFEVGEAFCILLGINEGQIGITFIRGTSGLDPWPIAFFNLHK
jgi:hypothetical protein